MRGRGEEESCWGRRARVRERDSRTLGFPGPCQGGYTDRGGGKGLKFRREERSHLVMLAPRAAEKAGEKGQPWGGRKRLCKAELRGPPSRQV